MPMTEKAMAHNPEVPSDPAIAALLQRRAIQLSDLGVELLANPSRDSVYDRMEFLARDVLRIVAETRTVR